MVAEEKKCLSQSDVTRQSWFSDPKKHKLGSGCWVLSSHLVSLNSVPHLQRRSQNCLSQSDAMRQSLLFRPKNTNYNLVGDVKILFLVKFRRIPLKPQSDIRCNRFATSPRLTIYTNRRGRNKVPDRSRRGCREVGDWSGTSLRPNQSQPGFCACTKTWLRLIWSQTGPGKVADQSPISRRLVADRSPTNFVRIGAWLSLKLVGD